MKSFRKLSSCCEIRAGVDAVMQLLAFILACCNFEEHDLLLRWRRIALADPSKVEHHYIGRDLHKPTHAHNESQGMYLLRWVNALWCITCEARLSASLLKSSKKPALPRKIIIHFCWHGSSLRYENGTRAYTKGIRLWAYATKGIRLCALGTAYTTCYLDVMQMLRNVNVRSVFGCQIHYVPPSVVM